MPSPQDARIRTCAYLPSQRYVINGLVGFTIDLNFGPTEQIKRAEFAYTTVDKDGNPVAAWRGPAAPKDQAIKDSRFKNHFPIWPFAEGHSNLIVITERDGEEHSYPFELFARKPSVDCLSATEPGCEDDNVTVAVMNFTYPLVKIQETAKEVADKKQIALNAWKAKRETDAVARMKVDPFYGPRNKDYDAKADPAYKFLAPKNIWDNGWYTVMEWPDNVQIPAISILDAATGEERVAPVSAQGQFQIITGTSPKFSLHLGRDKKAVMHVINNKWNADRPATGTGLSSPDVVRTVIQAQPVAK